MGAACWAWADAQQAPIMTNRNKAWTCDLSISKSPFLQSEKHSTEFRSISGRRLAALQCRDCVLPLSHDPMSSAKREVEQLLNDLPDNCSVEDIQYIFTFSTRCDRGLKTHA